MKHTPATPLPWEALGEMVHCGGDHPRIIAATFDRSAGNKQRDQQNARYAAHAANNYPIAIAFLKQAIDLYLDAPSGRKFAVTFPAVEIETFLRSIGEL